MHYAFIIKEYRIGVQLIPVPCHSTSNFTLSIGALDRAYNRANKQGLQVRGVLFPNPANPVGMSQEIIDSLVEFCRRKTSTSFGIKYLWVNIWR